MKRNALFAFSTALIFLSACGESDEVKINRAIAELYSDAQRQTGCTEGATTLDELTTCTTAAEALLLRLEALIAEYPARPEVATLRNGESYGGVSLAAFRQRVEEAQVQDDLADALSLVSVAQDTFGTWGLETFTLLQHGENLDRNRRAPSSCQAFDFPQCARDMRQMVSKCKPYELQTFQAWQLRDIASRGGARTIVFLATVYQGTNRLAAAGRLSADPDDWLGQDLQLSNEQREALGLPEENYPSQLTWLKEEHPEFFAEGGEELKLQIALEEHINNYPNFSLPQCVSLSAN